MTSPALDRAGLLLLPAEHVWLPQGAGLENRGHSWPRERDVKLTEEGIDYRNRVWE